MSDDLVKQLREGEEFAFDPTQSKVNIGPINDPIYIGEAKPFGTSVVQDIDAQLAEQVEWVKRLADDLIAAEGREARLEAKLAKAVEECACIAESHKPSAALLSDRYWRGVDEAAHSIAYEIYATLAELTGGEDGNSTERR